MKQKVLSIALTGLLLLAAICHTAAQEPTGVQWRTVAEVNELFAKEQRPIVFYLYEAGNDSCTQMTDSIFSNKEVADYINALFYAIKVEAHTKEKITFFDGTTYENTSGTHSFVYMLAGTAPSYPSMVCFNRVAQGAVFQGYKNRDAIFPILTYYAEDLYKWTTYDDYYTDYIVAYPPGKQQSITRVLVKWLTLEEALERQKEQPRKIFLDVTNNYKVSCTVMMLAAYNNPQIANYLNSHYYAVRINAMSPDTLRAWDTLFVNKNEGHPYHSLAVALVLQDGKMNFPAVFFIDEAGKILHRQIEYMTHRSIEPWLQYFAEDRFKTTKFDEYLKTFTTTLFATEK